MSMPSPFGDERLPQAYGGCTCHCHRVPGVCHCMPCCYPLDDEYVEPLITSGGELRPVTLWYTKVQKPGLPQDLEYNHMEDGHNPTNKPKNKCPEHEKTWKGMKWLKKLAWTDENNKVIDITPSQDYLDFMAALERGDHLNTDILPLTSETVTPVDELGQPVYTKDKS